MSAEYKKIINETRDKIAEIPGMVISIRNSIYDELSKAQGVLYASNVMKDLAGLTRSKTSEVVPTGAAYNFNINFFRHIDYAANERNILRGFGSGYPITEINDTLSFWPETLSLTNSTAYFPQNETVLIRKTLANNVVVDLPTARSAGIGCKFLGVFYDIDMTYTFQLTDNPTDTVTRTNEDGTSNTFSTYYDNYYFIASRETGKLLGPADTRDLNSIIGPNENLPLGSDFEFEELDISFDDVTTRINQIKNEGTWNSQYKKINIQKAGLLSSTFPNDASTQVTEHSWRYPSLYELDPLGPNFNKSIIRGASFPLDVNVAYTQKELNSFSNNSITIDTVRSNSLQLDGTDAVTENITFNEFAPLLNKLLFVKRKADDVHGDADSIFGLCLVVAPGTQINTDWLPVGDNSGSYSDTDFSNSNGASSQKTTSYSDSRFLKVLGSYWNGATQTVLTTGTATSIDGLGNTTLANGYNFVAATISSSITSGPKYSNTFGLNPFKPAIENANVVQSVILDDVGYPNYSNITRYGNGIINKSGTISSAGEAYSLTGDEDAYIGNFVKFKAANSTFNCYAYDVNQLAKVFREPSPIYAIHSNGATIKLANTSDAVFPDETYYPRSQSFITDAAHVLPHARYRADDTATGSSSSWVDIWPLNNNNNTAAHFGTNYPLTDYTKTVLYQNIDRMVKLIDDINNDPGSDSYRHLNWSLINIFQLKPDKPASLARHFRRAFGRIQCPSYDSGFVVNDGFSTKSHEPYYYSHPNITFDSVKNNTSIVWINYSWTNKRLYQVDFNNLYFKVKMDGLDWSKHHFPNGDDNGTPSSPYFTVRFGGGTDHWSGDVFNVYMGGPTPSPPAGHVAYGDGGGVWEGNHVAQTTSYNQTRTFYHYCIDTQATASSYPKYITYRRFKTVVRLSGSVYRTWYGRTNGNIRITKETTVDDNVTFAAPFVINLIASAIHGDDLFQVTSSMTLGWELGYQGSDDVQQLSTTTQNYHTDFDDSYVGSTRPFGNLDFGPNLVEQIKLLSKHLYCDSFFDNPYDSPYLSMGDDSDTNNFYRLSASERPTRVFRQYANNVANCMIIESIAATGLTNDRNRYYSSTLHSESEIVTRMNNGTNRIQMGIGTSEVLSQTITQTIDATYPSVTSDPNDFSNSVTIDLTSALGFTPTALDITKIEFRGDLSGEVRVIPGTYADIFYTTPYTGVYSQNYPGIYSLSYAGVYSQGFQHSYSQAFSTSYSAEGETFQEFYVTDYLGTLYVGLYSKTFSSVYSLGYSGSYSGTSGTFSGIYSQAFSNMYSSIFSEGFTEVYLATHSIYSGQYTDAYDGQVYSKPTVIQTYLGAYSLGYSGSLGVFSVGYTGPYSGLASNTIRYSTIIYTLSDASYSVGAYSLGYSGTYSIGYDTGSIYSSGFSGTYIQSSKAEYGLFIPGEQSIIDETLLVTLGNAGLASQISINIAGLNDGGLDTDVLQESNIWNNNKEGFKDATDNYMSLVYTSDDSAMLDINIQNSEFVDTLHGALAIPWQVKLTITGTRTDEEPGAEVFSAPNTTERDNSYQIGTKLEDIDYVISQAALNSRLYYSYNSPTRITQLSNTYSKLFKIDRTDYNQQVSYFQGLLSRGRITDIYHYIRDPLVTLHDTLAERYKNIRLRIGEPFWTVNNVSIIDSSYPSSHMFWEAVGFPKDHTNNYHISNTSITANAEHISTRLANSSPYGSYFYNTINFLINSEHPVNKFQKKLELISFPNAELADVRNFYEQLHGRLKQVYDDTE